MGTLSLGSILALLTAAATPPEATPRDHVDLIEINHFLDEQGKLVFDQLIFYDWCELRGRFQVRAWRLMKSDAQRPRYDFQTRDYVASWYDGDWLREVRAPSVTETWTHHDPEVVERQFLPKEKRMELSQPRQRTARTRLIAGP
jgi:hypothetical protein